MKYDVYIGNVEFSVTDELLVTVFSEVGRVLDIRMKQQNGRPAGFGFIEFGSLEEVRAAIALLDGRPVNGRPIQVSHSAQSGLQLEQLPKIPQAQGTAVATAVKQTLPPGQALTLLRELRSFAEAQPQQAREVGFTALMMPPTHQSTLLSWSG